MRQVNYAMVFRGGGEQVAPDHMRAWSTAPSASLTTRVGPEGIEHALVPADGEEAVFRSEVKLMGGTALDEWGTIAFGEGNVLHFQTIGEGYLAPAAREGVQHGVIMWEITNGEGAFEGATGLITSNFMMDDRRRHGLPVRRDLDSLKRTRHTVASPSAYPDGARHVPGTCLAPRWIRRGVPPAPRRPGDPSRGRARRPGQSRLRENRGSPGARHVPGTCLARRSEPEEIRGRGRPRQTWAVGAGSHPARHAPLRRRGRAGARRSPPSTRPRRASLRSRRSRGGRCRRR